MRMLLPGLILALAGTTAQAADHGFYLGAGVSKAKVDNIFGSGASLDIDNTAWKAIAGFRPLDLLAVEANYMDLGSENRSFGPATAHADAKAFSAHALLYLPIPVPFLGVYGKAGLARWDLSGNASGTSLVRLDDSGTEFAWGAGAQLSFGSLAARLEYDNFDIKHTDGLNLYTLGVTWTFL
jgi:Outer membrane protein beta-barrel domain